MYLNTYKSDKLKAWFNSYFCFIVFICAIVFNLFMCSFFITVHLPLIMFELIFVRLVVFAVLKLK